MRFLTSAFVILITGCGDATRPSLARVEPAEVRWVEWPFQVTSSSGESLRVVVYVPCAHHRIDVRENDATLSITARDSSADGTCLGASNGMYDSILPLPALHPEEPPELFRSVPYAVVADMHDPPSPGIVPVLLGSLELTFRPPFRPLRMVGGLVHLERDSAGCAWALPLGLVRDRYLVVNAPQLDATGYPYEALLGGSIVPVDPPQCGMASGISLRYADVFVTP